MTSAQHLRHHDIVFQKLTGAVPVWTATVEPQRWTHFARSMWAEHARFISVWGSDQRYANGALLVEPEPYHIHAAYCTQSAVFWLRLPVGDKECYPDLSRFFPAALRLQRALYELLGIASTEDKDQRPWLNHGTWPRDYFPLRYQENERELSPPTPVEHYEFVQVEGDGVHEIGVGPIHAGIIEPGHFRFSVVGEKVLRLEEHLGYLHKGIDQRFIGLSLQTGCTLAGRISGDSTVAFAIAYCMAVEAASACVIPERGAALRALMLERERIANHLGDLGALGNDAGMAFGMAQFSRLKEDCLRLNHRLWQHRMMMDEVIPGGVATHLNDEQLQSLLEQCAELENQLKQLRDIYDEHAGLQDRFMGTGTVRPDLAAELGLSGLAGRASGQAWDARIDHPWGPYTQLKLKIATNDHGDVAARIAVRFDEIFEAINFIRDLIVQLPAGTVHAETTTRNNSCGAGWVESWRGPVFVALETDGLGLIARCHCSEISWQNWPALQHAILGNIVPDFPLINKSFNLSYAGVDL